MKFPVSLLIKPVSSLCNLACKYCFYEDVSDRRIKKSYGLMSLETAQILIDKTFDIAGGEVRFSFQGGEPLLAGIDFFEKFVEKVAAANAKKLPVFFSVQTNGTLINEEWCRFWLKHRFLVGISIDGIEDPHNYLRAENGNGNFRQILKNIRLLQKFKIEYNLLCVVTKYSVNHAKSIYESLKQAGGQYLQFIPCLNPLDNAERSYSLPVRAFGRFLAQLYRLWMRDYMEGQEIRIQLFDVFLSRLQGKDLDYCALNGHCSLQNVVESDGSVFPCDFYCLDKYLLGNIRDDNWTEIWNSPLAKDFLFQKYSETCLGCRYFGLCRGGCRRDYVDGKMRLCESYKILFQEMMGENTDQ